MLKFTKLLYHNIGRRVKILRNSEKKNQDQFLFHIHYCNKPVLSHIENGKPGKDNHYLLPVSFISAITQTYKISAKEQIWGTKEEQETFVKILLLALVMNGEENTLCNGNPFFYSEDYDELFHWADEQKNIDSELKECVTKALDLLKQHKNICYMNICEWRTVQDAVEQKKQTLGKELRSKCMSKDCDSLMDFENLYYPVCGLFNEFYDMDKQMTGKKYITGKQIQDWLINHFKKENGFFFDSENQTSYDLLTKNPDGKRIYDNRYEYISNLLLKSILCNDIPFTFSFINRLCDKANTSKYDINKYVKENGQYGLLAIDNKKSDYHLFIKAFNKFWNNKKNLFVNYFDQNLFNKENMKKINDELFHDLLTSQEFAGIVRESYDMDRYCKWENIISYNYQLSTLQNSFIEKNRDKDNRNDAPFLCFAKYFNHVNSITKEFIETKCFHIEI